MLDDKQLKQAVLDELNWDPRVNSAHIGVAVKDGVVTVSGHVERYGDKSAAESAVRRVRGVKAIAEEIEVRLPFDVRRGDEEIAAAAVNRLKWDASLPESAITVKVENGWVTLFGDVDRRYQHDAASNDIRGLWDVVGVSNQIKSRCGRFRVPSVLRRTSRPPFIGRGLIR